MTDIGITTLILVTATIVCSSQGLQDHSLAERFAFKVDKIILRKDYKRLLTSGFFHVSWVHLFFNMASLVFFIGGVEAHLGGLSWLLIYFAGLLAGNLFTLFIYRSRGEYNSIGSSGAVTAIIFASIVLYPGFQIGFFGVAFPVPGWFYGFMFILFSLYGIKSKRGHISYEAQLSGGLTGLLIAVLIEPASLLHNYLDILCITIPSMFIIYITYSRPHFIMVQNKFFTSKKKNYTIEDNYHSENADQEEIDRILEKIHQSGIRSLTKIEKRKLDYYSKQLQ